MDTPVLIDVFFGSSNISLFTAISYRNKKETRSYVEISDSLGVDKPSEILFVTDVLQEAVAAKGAGNYWLPFLEKRTVARETSDFQIFLLRVLFT